MTNEVAVTIKPLYQQIKDDILNGLVKPLSEWREREERYEWSDDWHFEWKTRTRHSARAPDESEYVVVTTGPDQKEISLYRSYYGDTIGYVIGFFPNLESAKIAAEQDYRASVLSNVNLNKDLLDRLISAVRENERNEIMHAFSPALHGVGLTVKAREVIRGIKDRYDNEA